MYIKNGDYATRLQGIKPGVNGADDTLYLKDTIPTTVLLKGWQAQSSERYRGITLNASMDDVTVQCKLTTNGDYSLHRLFSVVLRYCLKRGRLIFDSYGMQVASFSYTPPMLSDQDEMEYESVCTINCKVTDTWIEKDWITPDDAGKITIELFAHSNQPDTEDVEFTT
jgi:hypothetical protein